MGQDEDTVDTDAVALAGGSGAPGWDAACRDGTGNGKRGEQGGEVWALCRGSWRVMTRANVGGSGGRRGAESGTGRGRAPTRAEVGGGRKWERRGERERERDFE